MLRALIDELEKDDALALAVTWVRTKETDPQIGYIDFGHPIVVDALAMHAIRARARTPTLPQPAWTKQ